MNKEMQKNSMFLQTILFYQTLPQTYVSAGHHSPFILPLQSFSLKTNVTHSHTKSTQKHTDPLPFIALPTFHCHSLYNDVNSGWFERYTVTASLQHKTRERHRSVLPSEHRQLELKSCNRGTVLPTYRWCSVLKTLREGERCCHGAVISRIRAQSMVCNGQLWVRPWSRVQRR